MWRQVTSSVRSSRPRTRARSAPASRARFAPAADSESWSHDNLADEAAAVVVQKIVRANLSRARDSARKAMLHASKQPSSPFRATLAHDSPDPAVDAPTPPEDWFTPRRGWPPHLLKPSQQFKLLADWKQPPRELMPTEAEQPQLFDALPAIGELRIEVLEAERLPKMDPGPFESTDAYALLLFETNAARSNACRRTRAPRWRAGESARAFAFPVLCPYSCVYVGLKVRLLLSASDCFGQLLIPFFAGIRGPRGKGDATDCF